jgi:hypothetical protein
MGYVLAGLVCFSLCLYAAAAQAQEIQDGVRQGMPGRRIGGASRWAQ